LVWYETVLYLRVRAGRKKETTDIGEGLKIVCGQELVESKTDNFHYYPLTAFSLMKSIVSLVEQQLNIKIVGDTEPSLLRVEEFASLFGAYMVKKECLLLKRNVN